MTSTSTSTNTSIDPGTAVFTAIDDANTRAQAANLPRANRSLDILVVLDVEMLRVILADRSEGGLLDNVAEWLWAAERGGPLGAETPALDRDHARRALIGAITGVLALKAKPPRAALGNIGSIFDDTRGARWAM